MDIRNFESILTVGENVAVEFKRCGSGIGNDVYESICSFLNRFGGDLFMGVEDDGRVTGLPEKTAPDMIKNFIKCISNPNLLSPTVYLSPEIIEYQEKTVIHVHVPPNAEVHSYKKVIYDRVDDADVRVTSTGQIAQMYIRKQGIFTEKKVYPYAGLEDLRLDLLPKLRIMAANNSGNQGHPWSSLSDEELLKSAGLYGKDWETGKYGYNLAAIMLLGKDAVISDIVPAYMTDALLRKVNVDRYDDREVIQTNLIESYEQLMEFGRKHLLDKFFLESDQRKSIRNIIVREMIANTLIHREYTNPYQARFVIEKSKMYVVNANRCTKQGLITPDNLEPQSKNPIIASFFRNIGYAEQLGSGVRNLFKYSRFYSGKDPEFDEGDIFKIIVPLDDNYSFDYGNSANGDSDYGTIGTIHDNGMDYKTGFMRKNIRQDMSHVRESSVPYGVNRKNVSFSKKSVYMLSQEEVEILARIKKNPHLTQSQIQKEMGISLRSVKRIMSKLQQNDILVRKGNNRSGTWIINDEASFYG